MGVGACCVLALPPFGPRAGSKIGQSLVQGTTLSVHVLSLLRRALSPACCLWGRLIVAAANFEPS